jgi:hypothetical protein
MKARSAQELETPMSGIGFNEFESDAPISLETPIERPVTNSTTKKLEKPILMLQQLIKIDLAAQKLKLRIEEAGKFLAEFVIEDVSLFFLTQDVFHPLSLIRLPCSKASTISFFIM